MSNENVMPDIALPNFSNIEPHAFESALEELLQTNLNHIEKLLEQPDPFTWDNLMHPLEKLDDQLEQFWSPLSHLHAVVNSPELRTCYQNCLPKLSAYESSIGQNQKLYEAIKTIDKSHLNETQVKIIEDGLLDFELSGVALSKEHKKEFEAIQKRLSELSNQFENNVLDATQAFECHIADESRLAGLPEHAISGAKALADEKGIDGWILNLEIPCYLAIATYAEDRALRKQFYEAFTTRASEVGPNGGQFDNTSLIDEILSLRYQKAKLLGFDHYSDVSLATKMAETPEMVLRFLNDLSQRARIQGEKEFHDLQKFAQNQCGISQLEPWDVGFVAEKKKMAEHNITQEALRPYFPLPKVLDGLFEIVQRLFAVTFKPVNNFDAWHDDVRCYELSDASGNTRGYLYMDLFARKNKRGGAWMDSCQSRRVLEGGEVQLPIAFLTCNFAKAVANKPATLSHDEMETLFHELGHCLHHLLTKVDHLSASGIHGVEWDAVELPSQFLENWCWEEEALALLSEHVETKAPLPPEMIEKLKAAKNFNSAMAMLRQLEFSLFDFRIHQEYQANKSSFVKDTLADVRNALSVVPVAEYNRFQNSFSHIFGGGYAAGYYSYKWAEVLSSDAYARFEDEGIFNPQTGQDFLHCILEVGSSKKAADAFECFRGRAPSITALLRHNGISG